MINTEKELKKILWDTDREIERWYREDKASQKTRAQERTYYRCFSVIWNKLGYSGAKVKSIMLKAVFGVDKIKAGGIEWEEAKKPSTKDLTKEEAQLLIDAMIQFAKNLWLWDIVTPREYLLYQN